MTQTSHVETKSKRKARLVKRQAARSERIAGWVVKLPKDRLNRKQRRTLSKRRAVLSRFRRELKRQVQAAQKEGAQ